MSKTNQGNDQVIADFFKTSMKVLVLITIIISVLFFYFNHKNKNTVVDEKKYQEPTKFTKAISPPTTNFVEQARLRGIDFMHSNGATGEKMLPETMGAGVAFIDFDNDGDEDILFANGTNWDWDEKIDSTQKMYANDGKGFFTDVTQSLGLDGTFYATGIAIGDINSDGFDDIYFSAVGKNRIYLNHEGKSFIQSKNELDCTDDGWSTSAGFFDYDNDGDLDLMVLNYVQWSRELDLAADYKIDGIGRAYGPPSNFPGTHNCLFENQEGRFVDVTEQSGIIIQNDSKTQYAGKSLALTFLDINSDGWQDVVVANDTTKNFVYVNQKDKTFTEQGAEYGLAYNASGKATGAMGLDSAQYKNDKDMAVTVGNFANEMTSFYVNRANLGFFTDESVITGIGPQSRLALSFGLFFFDYDLDGRLDFFQTNGHVENDINKVQAAQHYAQKSQLFWNCGDQCERTYLPVEDAGDINSLNMVGRAAAYADVDNDGDLDVIVTQVAAQPKLFINESKTGNWIGVKLSGSNSLVGAKITLHTNANKQTYTHNSTKSYLAQVQKNIIFGLGEGIVNKIVINYKDSESVFTNLEKNQWNKLNFEP